MDTQTIVNIIAILLSPIIAIGVGELLRKRSFKKDKRLAILYNLMAYRNKVESDEFLSALNSLKLFYQDENLYSLTFELRKSFQATDLDRANVLIAKIIKRVCELEKFNHISTEDIDNLFKKK
ncbi:MAG: hypothetical protein KJ594_05225 [Candidatus Omnitrophica bacterium]|nr:hypothetical protein [Candidatus Omnitrophota bacterium]